MSTTTWHRFLDTYDPDADDQCADCGVVVEQLAHDTFTLPCPVPDCTSPRNPSPGCVFSPGAGMARCVYCSREGDRDGALVSREVLAQSSRLNGAPPMLDDEWDDDPYPDLRRVP